MTKYLFGVIVIGVLAVPVAYSLTMMTLQNPFADINKLGTVVRPCEGITIQSTNGTVTVEYSAPTKRRIIWNGESRDIGLLKSTVINGIYSGGIAKFEQGPIGNIYGVSYVESTITFSSDEEYRRYLYINVEGLGFEHREDDKVIVRVKVGGNDAKKYLYIGITKYQFADGVIQEKKETGKGD